MTATSPPSCRRVDDETAATVCIVGASGKLGRYMVQQCLDKGYGVVAVCREVSVGKLADLADRIRIVPGHTNDPAVIAQAVQGCQAVLVVLVPWGTDGYASGTAQAVLDHAEVDARLVFSCGWHISKDGRDRYSLRLRAFVRIFGWLARLFGLADLDDQVAACNRVFASKRDWTVVRGCDLEEGPSQGLPRWAEHVGDPLLASNRMRRIDFARFMVEAIDNKALIQKAPALVGCTTASALRHPQRQGDHAAAPHRPDSGTERFAQAG